VHSPQLGQLTLEPLNPGMLLTTHSHPLVGIHLGVAHTAAQRLGCPHTQLGSYDLDAGPLPAIARAYLGDSTAAHPIHRRRKTQTSDAENPCVAEGADRDTIASRIRRECSYALLDMSAPDKDRVENELFRCRKSQ
jgi:hypothetical protein